MKLGWFLVWTMLLGFTAVGCGGSGSGSGSNGGGDEEQVDEVATSAIKRREVDTLPEVEAHLPPYGSSQLRVAPPKGWRPIARDAKYIARFVKGEPNELPRIAISSAPSPSPELTNASEDDPQALVGPLNEKSKEGKRKPIEPVRPIILGDKLFGRHVRIARFNDEPCAIVSLQTVRDGQLYSIELYVPAGSDGSDYPKFVKQHQEAAYAVAANLKFGDDPAPAPLLPPTEDKPAEEEKAEETPAETE